MDIQTIFRSRTKALEDWPGKQFTTCGEQFDLVVHGVPLRFHFSDKMLQQQLVDFFPRKWQSTGAEPIDVYWRCPEELTTGFNPDWQNVSDPNCYFLQDFILQRDFTVKRLSRKSYQLVTPTTIDDGLFNFLRALLPTALLSQNKILFHSSTVVDRDGQAHVFFGPSGAGKTTIASLCQDAGAVVLGDDMNLLTVENERVSVEVAVVGQRIFNQEMFGRKFTVKNMYWLEKSTSNSIEPIVDGGSAILLSSFANLFWNQLDANQYQSVFAILTQLSQHVELNKLAFKKSDEVWNYVQHWQ